MAIMASCASKNDSLQLLNERSDVALMGVFYKYMNSSPSNELSCIVPLFPTDMTDAKAQISVHLSKGRHAKNQVLVEELHVALDFHLERSFWGYCS